MSVVKWICSKICAQTAEKGAIFTILHSIEYLFKKHLIFPSESV